MRRKIQENIHNPGFTYGNLVALMQSIIAQEPGTADSQMLDQAFSANDTIMFLGALGAAEIPGFTAYGFEGGDENTPIPDFDQDPYMDPNVAGYHEPGSGSIRVNPQTFLRLMQGTPTIADANTAVHEIMHRGFSMVYRTAEQYSQLRSMLPQDLYTVWRGGWGVQDTSRFPIIDITNSAGEVEYPNMQINPEHCMIYAMTTQPDGFHDRLFVQTVPQLAWGQQYFNQEWQSNFNNRYDDLTRDRPTTDMRRMRTYWRILYYNTERGLSRFLRTVLGQPPNIPSSPRPQPRPTAGTSEPRTGSMADLLGIGSAGTASSSGWRRLTTLEFNTISLARDPQAKIMAAVRLFTNTRVRMQGSSQSMSGREFVQDLLIPNIVNNRSTTVEDLLLAIEIQ